MKKVDTRWILSDEGNTFMHLSYDIDIDTLDKGTRAKIINTSLHSFGITEKGGALFAPVHQENMGNVFYNYIQGLIKITDLTYLSRERVKSTFMEDFKSLKSQNILADRIKFNFLIYSIFHRIS